jgi:signal transduction histidine kinase
MGTEDVLVLEKILNSKIVSYFTSTYQQSNVLIYRKARVIFFLHSIMLLLILLYASIFLVLGEYIFDIIVLFFVFSLLVLNLFLLRRGAFSASVAILLLLMFLGFTILVYPGAAKSHLKLYSLATFYGLTLLLAGLVSNNNRFALVLGLMTIISVSYYLFVLVLPDAVETLSSMLDAYVSVLIVLTLSTISASILNGQLSRAFLEVSEMQEHLEEKIQERTQMLEDSRAQLVEKEKLAALGGMVGGLSHEINTPLGNSITAHSFFQEKLQALKTSLDEDAITKTQLEAFLKDAESVGVIVERNLQIAVKLLANFKQASQDLHLEEQSTISVHDNISTIVESTFQKALISKHISVDIVGDRELTIYCSPSILWQILTNILTNAKAHAFAENTGHIKISYGHDGECFLLEIIDNGKGMDSETLKRLFEPFFTTKRGAGGTGLGMNIVHNLVSKAGGTIECTSALEAGTSFSIRIPWEKAV